MDTMACLKETLEDALRSIGEKKNISPSDIETATKALCALEQIRVMESTNSYSRGHSYCYDGASHGGPHMRMHDEGYSGHSIKDRMIAKLEEMYDQAKSDHEKQVVDEWIAKIEGQK